MSTTIANRKSSLRTKAAAIGIAALAGVALGATPAQAATSYTDTFCGYQYPPSGITRVLTGHHGLPRTLVNPAISYQRLATFTVSSAGVVTSIVAGTGKGTCP